MIKFIFNDMPEQKNDGLFFTFFKVYFIER